MSVGIIGRVDCSKRGRGRPRLTWEEVVKMDLKIWGISEELVTDRSEWKLAIYVPEP